MTDTVTPDPVSKVIFEEPSPVNESLSGLDEPPLATSEPLPLIKSPPANYQPPSVREIQENMTVMYYDAEERPVCRPKDTGGDVQSESAAPSEDRTITRSADIPTKDQLPEPANYPNVATSTARSLELCCD